MIVLRLVAPVEAGGRGMAPSEVRQLTLPQVHLFVQSCEDFERGRPGGWEWKVSADREVLEEMRAIPQFAPHYPAGNDGALLAEAHRQRMRELRKRFTGSEELKE